MIDTTIDQLSLLILTTTLESTKQLSREISDIFGQDSKVGRWVWASIYLELLFFYLHTMNRFAYKQMGIKKSTMLLKLVLPYQLEVALTSNFDNIENSHRILFFDIYNSAEIEYTKCTSLIIEGEPFSKMALLTVISTRVEDIIKRNSEGLSVEYSPLKIMLLVKRIIVNELAIKGFQRNLEILVKEIEYKLQKP